MERERQKRANKIATDNGYDKADYIGSENGLDVWLGSAVRNGVPALLGLPLWITCDSDWKFNHGFGFEYMHLVKE